MWRHLLTMSSLALVLNQTAFCESRPVVVMVRDPQLRPINGAHVIVNCGTRAWQERTNADGHCSLNINADWKSCRATVTHMGFSPVVLEIGERQFSIAADMHLAPLQERIEVRADPDNLQQFDYRSMTSGSFSQTQLETISNDPAVQLRYAKLAAGVISGSDAVYVDGMPSATLPAAGMIRRIDVNIDPFSAEYSDGDANRINIITRNPERKFRFSFGDTGFGAGGSNPLAKGLKTKSHAENARLTGSIPHLPLTFAAYVNIGSNETDQPVLATLPASLTPAGLPVQAFASTGTRTTSVNFESNYALSASERIHAFLQRTGAAASNVGAGGLTLPEAASRSAFVSRDFRATFDRSMENKNYRAGFAFNETSSQTQANTTGPQISVPGNFAAGGSLLLRDQSTRSHWMAKNVLESANSSAWSLGATVTRSFESRTTVPNEHGQYLFPTLDQYTQALAGEPTGTWMVTRGNGAASYSSIKATPFAQKQILHKSSFSARAGLRGDYQTGFGLQWSPMFSVVANVHGFAIRAGAGLFRRELSNSVFIRAIANDGSHLTSYVQPLVDLVHPPDLSQLNNHPIVTRLSPDMTYSRQSLQKYSVERSFRSFTPGLEYTATRDWRLAGSRRLDLGQSWVDLIESNRRSASDRIHAKLNYRWKNATTALHYEWIRSRDNTSGTFSYPELQDNYAAEWARSAGVPAHNVALVASISLPKSVALNITDYWHGSAPYNITTGKDPSGLDLFTDRGGLARNSGNGPAYNSLLLYLHKRFGLTKRVTNLIRRSYLDLGLNADNLLQNRNYTEFGSVLGSDTFGKPLSALAGRSVRMWINFE